MRIIAITTPEVTDKDASIISGLLDWGVDTVHLRKPDSDIGECRALLAELTAEQRGKIIVHDYPELYFEFSLKGIHVNRNVAVYPNGYDGFRSCSCHSFEKVIRNKGCFDYLFLSPIFDSISKNGYLSGFGNAELRKASEKGVIDEKVIALGGVTFDKMDYLKELGFGGVAMIGGLYNVEALSRLKDIAL